jgi:26S proteasome regulatory subunit N1
MLINARSHLAAEIIDEYNVRSTDDTPTDELLKLALEMVPFLLAHNAEADACDLLLELEALDRLPAFIDKNTFSRVALYLTRLPPAVAVAIVLTFSCASYVPVPDDVKTLRVVHAIYHQHQKWPEALMTALKLNDKDLIADDFNTCPDPYASMFSFCC